MLNSVVETLPNVGYYNRETKASYVYDKYQSILKGSVLDVGADSMFLKPYVERGGGKYIGIGFGENVDQVIDLDSSALPFQDASFDTVVCLDVLEHLESIHFMFSELCRVSKKHVIISLPNPYFAFFSMLRSGDYAPGKGMKFYNLPLEVPEDRHRWFYSESEARNFLSYNSKKLGFTIAQIDAEGDHSSLGGRGLKGFLARQLLKILFRSDIESLNIHHGNLWTVLQRL
jgi:hypothetical protein